jgi:hypothetical protein
VLVASLALAGCSKGDAPESAARPSAAAAQAPASAASYPIAGVIPQSEETPASGTPGPGSGQTAVGGLAGHQDKDGANSAKAPAPTGGDAAASGPK